MAFIFRYTILLLLTLFFQNVFTQETEVKNIETNEYVRFVNIYSANKKVSTVSSESGVFDLSIFKDIDTIVFSAINYNTFKTSFDKIKKNNNVVYLKPTSYQLGQVVISANRWDQNSSVVPNQIRSIKKKDLNLLNPQTSADAIGIKNGVYIQKSQQGGGSPMIRGFSSNRLLYAVDGVRMNNAIFRSGNLHNVISLDAFANESIEVLFGPNSVIYGSDAIGGVMSFSTLKPFFSDDSIKVLSANYYGRYSTANNEVTNHIDINLANKKWSSLSSVSFSNFQSMKMGKNGPEEYKNTIFSTRYNGEDVVATAKNPLKQYSSGFSQLNLMQKFGFKLNSKTNITYAFHFSESSDIPRYDRQIQTSDNKPIFAEWYYGPQKWVMHHLNFHLKNKTTFYDEVQTNIAIQQFVESRHSRRFGDNIKSNKTENVDAFSANIDFLKTIKNQHKISYGIEAIHNNVSSEGTSANIKTLERENTVSRYPDSKWNSFALYVTNNYSLSEKTNLVGGLRLNQFDLMSNFDTSLFPYPTTKATLSNKSITGSFGLVYRPTNTFKLNLLVGTGFRAPNVDDIGKVFDSEPGSIVVPNNNLKAEYAYNYEISLSKKLKNSLAIEIALFFTQLDNAMVRRNATFNNLDSINYEGVLSQVQQVQNAAKAYVYGLEASFEYLLLKSVKLSSQISFQKGEEELNDGSKSPSRHVAPLFGKTSISFIKNLYSIIVYADYSGEVSNSNLNINEQGKEHLYAQDKKGLPYSPAWYTLNLKSNFKVSSRFLLGVGIENITSQRYRTYSSGLAAPGRNFIFSLKANI
jgi:hemoglobin/transferrin/lactoferrin receptor protein